MVGDAVCLPASHDATGVYFRQPQSEEPVLQSLMMRGGGTERALTSFWMCVRFSFLAVRACV